MIDKGIATPLSGTSASAPTFAGIVALLNAAGIQAGKSPLGFLNPFLYSKGYEGLNDIVKGESQGCLVLYSGQALLLPTVPYASWNATPGWDPVTGLGTPDFQKLVQLSMDAA